MTNTTPLSLHCEALHYRVGARALLKNVGFSAGAGQFIGLIGPNGAGKSTLLKTLAGLWAPSAGKVLLNQQSLPEWPPRARAKTLALLAQQEAPAWSLSVRALVALGRLPHTGSLAVALAREGNLIDLALTAADVAHLAERTVDTLSGGELRRVQCARLFATVADIWLADEPIAALDPLHQLHIMQLLKTKAETGLVIAALHDLTLAARFCDRILLMNDGELIADGTPTQVLTEDNLARVYRIRAQVQHSADGVSIVAQAPLTQSDLPTTTHAHNANLSGQ
ncbi:ABC transporter ATP-binding protein [Simiduia aestuariiviva]|uniref:Iron complex transport system ATP-binding protein n=1 Tax=Simiduia aestuariiviva TaxID=1510459 RepID=A0A839UN47_9GAMM|nr:ABC transporter ATP-binding protein [Simiduia aestuariiviva]MBB3167166.1 iron complex transport system ATP-binding protein [Simiduia aestuariiviva]